MEECECTISRECESCSEWWREFGYQMGHYLFLLDFEEC